MKHSIYSHLTLGRINVSNHRNICMLALMLHFVKGKESNNMKRKGWVNSYPNRTGGARRLFQTWPILHPLVVWHNWNIEHAVRCAGVEWWEMKMRRRSGPYSGRCFEPCQSLPQPSWRSMSTQVMKGNLEVARSEWHYVCGILICRFHFFLWALVSLCPLEFSVKLIAK